jgi:predicted transposase/invertase (TIGR01784 family)
MRRTLDPKNDLVFKLIFGNPKYKCALIALLTAVLEPSVPIRDAEVKNPEIPRNLPKHRGIVLDIHVILNDGRHIDVEMQTELRPGLSERFLYYWARMFGAQLKPADSFTKLRPCVSVLFLGRNLLPGQRFHSTFRVQEIRDHYELTDALSMHIVELSKLASASPGDRLLGWGKFFTAQSDEELEVLVMTNPEIAEAKEALETVSANKQHRSRAMQRDLEWADYIIPIHAAHDEGEARGKVEGLLVAVRGMAELLGISIDAARESHLEGLSVAELEHLAEALRSERRWPEGS